MNRFAQPSLALLAALAALGASEAWAEPRDQRDGYEAAREHDHDRRPPASRDYGYPYPAGPVAPLQPPRRPPTPYLVGPPGPVYDGYYGGRNSLGADWSQQQDEARAAVRTGRIRPLSQIVQTLKRRAPGRVLDAGIEYGSDGRPTYRVRWAASGGRRVDFIVDAVSGQILYSGGY